MRSAFLSAQDRMESRPLRIRETEIPELKEGEILIRVEACGVCHSDLHIIEGDLPLPEEMFPLVPGHEIVGTVERSRGAVSEGKRVGTGWFGRACGKCDYCVSGKENLCPSAQVNGLNIRGGYSEYVVAYSNYVTEIPDSISSTDAAPLFCAGLTAFTSVKKLNMNPGDRIAVYGIGGLGHYALQFINKLGGEAIAITGNHAELAGKSGASDVLKKPEGKFDGSIVFAPSSEAARKAVKHTKSGGTIVIPAIMDKIEVPFSDFLWEKNITSVASGLRPDTRNLMDFVSRNGVESMIKTMKLEQVNEALISLKNNSVEGRIVLTP